MSTAIPVGVSLVVVGTAVWSQGAMFLTRANPGRRVPRDGNERYGRYRATYIIGFACAIFGGFQLKDEYGWWTYAAALAVFITPATTINTVHNRRLRRRTSTR